MLYLLYTHTHTHTHTQKKKEIDKKKELVKDSSNEYVNYEFCPKLFKNIHCLQKRNECFSFLHKVFNKPIILVNKDCMVFVCYPWMSKEFYLIDF